MDQYIEELFPFYAMGAITDEEKTEVEAYIQANPTAEARLIAAMAAADNLAFLAEPMSPSAPVKESVLAYARRRPNLSGAPTILPPAPTWWQRLRQGLALPVFAGLATVTAILLFIWVLSLRSLVGNLESQVATLAPLETAVTELQSQVAALQPLETTVTELQDQLNALQPLETTITDLQIQIETLQRELAQRDDILAALPEGNGLFVAGTDVQPRASGELLVWDEGRTAVFIATALEALPPEQTYQLWLIGESGPVSEGVFTINDNGIGLLEVTAETAVFNYTNIGVSIEPEGGSPQPTGDIVMLGAIVPPGTDS